MEDKMPDTEIVDELPGINKKESFFKRVKGSDPTAATCRGKLQFRRSKLNQNINKHLMLRQGAENLFRAAENNRRVRDSVSLELSFINSSLQALKDELSELNSSVEVYQNEATASHMPMIPFGFKETKYINFADFGDFIMEHYGEDPSSYLVPIQEFTDLRQAVRTPKRSEAGIDLLFRYYNQLYFIERRFFPADRFQGVLFEWFDSLTGLPSTQRAVAFEKASLLFNLAALYSQLAVRQDRAIARHLDLAIDNYLRAAGVYRYILDNFSNAPSRDLQPDVLQILFSLLMAQACECLLERLATPVLELEQDSDGGLLSVTLSHWLELAQEAQQVSDCYTRLHEMMKDPLVEGVLPVSWCQLTRIKSVHYRATAHQFYGTGLLSHEGPISRRTSDLLQVSQKDCHENMALVPQRVPRNSQQRKFLGKCHLSEAVLLHEESQRLFRMSRELKRKEQLQRVLFRAHELCSDRFLVVSKIDELIVPVQPPEIVGRCKYELKAMSPEFGQYQVEDLFAGLGPLEVFNCHRYWSTPRPVCLRRQPSQGLGFSVKMEAPVVVEAVEQDSLASHMGLKNGDFIVAVNDEDVKWASHAQVVAAIRSAGLDLNIHVVTPIDKAAPSESCVLSSLRSGTLSGSSGVFNTWSSVSTSSGVSSTGTPGYPHTSTPTHSARPLSVGGSTPLSTLADSAVKHNSWKLLRRLTFRSSTTSDTARADSGLAASSPSSTLASCGSRVQ